MTNTGDGISVSLDELALTLRAIVGRRTDFPAASELAETQGPAGGASQVYRRSLNQVAQAVSRLTLALNGQLGGLEADIATTGQQLVAADESAGQDVFALQRILATVDDPVPATPPPGAAPGPATGIQIA